MNVFQPLPPPLTLICLLQALILAGFCAEE